MKIWIKVSDDKYEFPEVIADSCAELARKCGVGYYTILAHICRERKGEYVSRYKCVEVEDD